MTVNKNLHSLEHYNEIRDIIGKNCGIFVSPNDPAMILLILARQANDEAYENFTALLTKFEIEITQRIEQMEAFNNSRAEKMISVSLVAIKQEARNEKDKNIKELTNLFENSMKEFYSTYMFPNLLKLRVIKKLVYLSLASSGFAFLAALIVLMNR